MHIQENILLKNYTTFKIGGPAKFFVDVTTEDEIIEALEWANERGEKIFVLGGGSNVLVSDQGFAGLVIHLSHVDPVINGNKMTCFSGAILLDALYVAQRRGLSGMEKMAGIPGTVGGATRGNAAAFGCGISDTARSVDAYNYETRERKVFTVQECEFDYRSSFFKKNPQWIVLSTMFELDLGNGEAVLQSMEETIAQRNAKHLQDALCAGSFFMNPIVKNAFILGEFEKDTGSKPRGGRVPAGWLIDQAGLRGKKMGGAQVSEQHSNYIINTGEATAEDVIMLMSYVKQQVRATMEVELHMEAQMIGF